MHLKYHRSYWLVGAYLEYYFMLMVNNHILLGQWLNGLNFFGITLFSRENKVQTVCMVSFFLRMPKRHFELESSLHCGWVSSALQSRSGVG